jgi:hypothetical protein
MEEVLNATKINIVFDNNCVLCENLEYKNTKYESLCYNHKRELLWVS